MVAAAWSTVKNVLMYGGIFTVIVLLVAKW